MISGIWIFGICHHFVCFLIIIDILLQSISIYSYFSKVRGSFIANKSVMLYKKDGEQNLQNLFLILKCESYFYILTQDPCSVRPKTILEMSSYQYHIENENMVAMKKKIILYKNRIQFRNQSNVNIHKKFFLSVFMMVLC